MARQHPGFAEGNEVLNGRDSSRYQAPSPQTEKLFGLIGKLRSAGIKTDQHFKIIKFSKEILRFCLPLGMIFKN